MLGISWSLHCFKISVRIRSWPHDSPDADDAIFSKWKSGSATCFDDALCPGMWEKLSDMDTPTISSHRNTMALTWLSKCLSLIWAHDTNPCDHSVWRHKSFALLMSLFGYCDIRIVSKCKRSFSKNIGSHRNRFVRQILYWYSRISNVEYGDPTISDSRISVHIAA